MTPKIRGREVTGVLIYLDRSRTRTFVGKLQRDQTGEYVFSYDPKYRELRNALAFGPEFPLTTPVYRSKKLFPAFLDRLPDEENPAYPEYIQKFNLSKHEKDPMVLLPTIGRAGPSRFFFEPAFVPERPYLKTFRTELKLTTREFSRLFDVSIQSLYLLESGKAQTPEVAKRLAIYQKFPEVAIFEIERNRHNVLPSVSERVMEVFKRRLQSRRPESHKM